MPEKSTTPNITEVIQKIFGSSFTVGMTFPGESIIVAGFKYGETVRETMDDALLKRYDAVMVQILEDSYKVYRDIWVKAGVLK